MFDTMTARGLTQALQGRWLGSYGSAKCPAHNDHSPSLAIRDGNDGKLLVHCHTGCEQAAVVDALKGRGLWPGKPNDTQMSRTRDISRPKKREDDNARQQAALTIWRDAEPAAGTLAETYLQSRSIVTAVPPSLRFAPALTHGPTGLPFPAMVAGVQDVTGKITGIHRTFLMLDGTGKARVSSPKMMLGKCAGGAVRLALAKDTIAVAEGIEDALSVMQETGIPAWAALSTSGLKALLLPETIINVTICADNDEPGEKAAQEAAQRWLAEGRTVRIARPPGGHKDFNAALMAGTTQDIPA